MAKSPGSNSQGFSSNLQESNAIHEDRKKREEEEANSVFQEIGDREPEHSFHGVHFSEQGVRLHRHKWAVPN
jgi:hypothetical protein